MVMFNILQSLVASIPQNLGVLFEIGIIIIVATFLAFLIRILRQPIIPAYILSGIIIGPLILGLIRNNDLITSLSEIGIAFLIFTAGLEIKFKKLKEVGRAVLIGGILQILILSLITFFISIWLGFKNQSALYIGLVVAFSSTMIVVKLLADKKEINSLHGRIIIGILLIQDLAAIIALTILSSNLSLTSISIVILKTLVFAIVAFLLSILINPIFKISAKTPELLLLVSISFLFLFVIGSFAAGLSLVIGAFFAGVALANSDYKTEIQGKIAPLREFFSVIFFVALGMQLKIISKEYLSLFFILIILIIIVKPLITMFLIRTLGYKKRTSFLTGNALAQTSEFSLIIITLGLSLGHIDRGLFSSLVLITIFTMSLSTYMIGYERKLSLWLDWPLNIFNNFHTKREDLEYHSEDGKKIIIFGCHRMGSLFLKEFEKEKKDIFVVDYDPDIINPLINKKIPCIYGDFVNEEILKKANIKHTEIIIGTIPDFENNLMLIRKVRKLNQNVIIFVVAERISEAQSLYKAGADYVILPRVISGQRAFELIRKLRNNKSELKRLKKEHLKYLDSVHHILY